MRSRFAFGQLAFQRKAPLVLCLALGILGVGLLANAQEGNARFITFDAPGAGTGAGQGTVADSINASGAITGWYFDANFLSNGYLRAADGTFVTFQAPGAGTGSFQGTEP